MSRSTRSGGFLLDQLEAGFAVTGGLNVRFRPAKAEAEVHDLDDLWFVVDYQYFHVDEGNGALPHRRLSIGKIGAERNRVTEATKIYVTLARARRVCRRRET